MLATNLLSAGRLELPPTPLPICNYNLVIKHFGTIISANTYNFDKEEI